ncbi:DUF4129 domain-containing protein [Halorientalis sp. IM1011]|uniref:DUF4129 domain-containing protein n=1 Tax=Halorientalis sp. IM1011 TaxID=1932360 RepID=UPI0012F8A307|nr:DUF4129 domain-containing protein [Halorientalis sp. IM1011]
MDWERVASIGVAALCMTAIGVAATTLDSTVSQTPDDLIDLGDTQLPIGDDSTGEIDDQIEQNKQSQGSDQTGQVADPEPGGQSQQQSSDDPGERTGERESGSGPLGLGPGGQSLLQQLLDLLRKLLPFLLALVALALAYRYRDRLLGILLAPLAALPENGSDERDTTARDPWVDVDPDDRIDRAWYAMVRRLDVDRPWARTPDECRSAAVDAGLDPDAVGTLTRLFRRKRFAAEGLPSEERERAAEVIDRLELGGRTR